MPQPENKRCKDCRYAEISQSITCRRHPPTIHTDTEEDDFGGCFPEVRPSTWCGAWEPASPESLSEAATTIARLVVIGDKSGVYALVDKLVEDRNEEGKP